MEQNTLDIINGLEISESQKSLLLETIEWEKELSWSDGYAISEDQWESALVSAGVLSQSQTESK